MAAILVVYESCFGNTEQVARAVAEGLAESGPEAVQQVEVGSAPDALDPDVRLLVVGAPTHAFGMSRPATRAQAREQGGGLAGDRGVREWLDQLEVAPTVEHATFDTRVRRVALPGSAARAVARRLRATSPELAAPTSFVVAGTAGPLLDGELDRAREWGRTLAQRLAAHAAVA